MSVVVFVMLVLTVLMIVKVVSVSSLGRRGSFHIGALCGTVYFFVVPALVLCFQGELEVPDPRAGLAYARIGFDLHADEILLSTALVLAFTALQVVAFVIDARWERPRTTNRDATARDLIQLALSWGLLVVLIGLYYVFVMRGASHWYLAKGEFFASTGVIGVAFQFVVFGLHLGTFALIAACTASRQLRLVHAGVAMMVILLLDLIVIGNRIMVLAAAVLVVFVLIRMERYRVLAFCTVAGLGLGTLLSAFSVFRYYLYSDGFAGAIERYVEVFVSGETHVFEAVFETVNLNIYVSLVRDFGWAGAGAEFATFLKPLYAFVPRSLFEGKLDSMTVLVGEMYDDRYGLSLVPLIFGESWMNVGVFTPIVLALTCVAMNRFIRVVFPEVVAPYMGLVAGFLFVRFPFSDLVLFAAMTVPVYFGTELLSRFAARRRAMLVQ